MQSLLSPRSLKYLGSRTSEKVKNKILELLYSWTVGLPEEVKIAEAYQMLKKQGEAPELGVTAPSALPWGSSSFRALAARSWVVPFNCSRPQSQWGLFMALPEARWAGEKMGLSQSSPQRVAPHRMVSK